MKRSEIGMIIGALIFLITFGNVTYQGYLNVQPNNNWVAFHQAIMLMLFCNIAYWIVFIVVDTILYNRRNS